MKLRLLALLLIASLGGALRAADPLPEGLYAEFTTPRGVIVAELFFEKTPVTVASFVGLAEGSLGPKKGTPYFDGLTFHRVVPDFVVQGGDPLGTGEGGPGYEFPDELVPGLRHDAAGMLSMANAGPDTNGSQFFFTLRPVNRLNYLHSVFGRTVQGLDVLPLIEPGDAMQVKILRFGDKARTFRADQEAFDALKGRLPRARPLHFDDPEMLLPLDPPRARALNFKLENFERFTGRKIHVRLLPKWDPANGDSKPGQLARRWAERGGVEHDGVAVVYWADRDTWALWIGDAVLDRFNPSGGSLHDAKQAFLTAARARTAEVIAAAEKTARPDKPLTDGQKLKLQADEIVDGLITLLEAPE